MRTWLFLLLMAFGSFGATRYVSGALYYDGTELGTNADPYGGACGLQKAIAATAAGDTIKVYDTVRTMRKRTVAYDGLVGGFVAGETITNITRSGTAVVYTDNGSNSMVVEVTSGTFLNNDEFHNSDGDSADVLNTPAFAGITNSTSGTNALPIFLIGTKVDWTVDSTVHAVLDGESTSLNWQATGGVCWFFYHIDFVRSSIDGFKQVSGTVSDCVFYNCRFNQNAARGLVGGPDISYYINCEFNSNGYRGFDGPSQPSLYNCTITRNNDVGISSTGICVINNCIVAKNTSIGILLGANTSVTGCVVDSNGGAGIKTYTADLESIFITKTRITRNVGLGIETRANDIITLGTGVIYLNNGSSNAVGSTGNVVYIFPLINSGTRGYENESLQVYNLTGAATARRVTAKIGCY